MDRRTFVAGLGGALGGASLASLALAATREQGADFSAWTWVHGNDRLSDAEWRQRFARIRQAGITAVLVSGGDAARLANASRSQGLAFHRWTWIMNRSGDARVKQEHPEWFSVSRTGESSLTKPPYVNYYQWLCPSREPVREYLRGVVDAIALQPGVEGVHFDYVRHPDVILPRGLWAKYNLVQNTELAEFDFCYCDVCREEFRRQAGRDPRALADPASDREWREFRWNAVTETVRVLSRAVRERGKQATAAVFPTPTIARRLVRQAWEQWPLDAVFPMLYNGFYEEDIAWIGECVREGIAALSPVEPLYAGLYLPDLDPQSLGRAVAMAREAGAAGVALFEMNGLTDGHLAVMRQALRG